MIEQRETAYQKIEVWDDAQGRRALALNGDIQFFWTAKERLISGLRCEYYNVATAAAGWAEGGARDVLIVGLGGGLIPWQLRRFHPEIRIACLELDPAMAEIASRWLPLSSAGPVELRIGDGRALLERDARAYDFVLLDAFLGSGVPKHMITREFFEAARRRLTPGGVAVANFHTSLNASGLLARIEATFASVFPTVGVVELTAGTTLLIGLNGAGSIADRMTAGAARVPRELGDYSRNAARDLRPASSGGDPLRDGM